MTTAETSVSARMRSCEAYTASAQRRAARERRVSGCELERPRGFFLLWRGFRRGLGNLVKAEEDDEGILGRGHGKVGGRLAEIVGRGRKGVGGDELTGDYRRKVGESSGKVEGVDA